MWDKIETGRVDADCALIRRLLQCQASRDWAGLAAAFHDDAVFDIPFIGEAFRGRDEIVARMRPSLERMDGLRFFDLDIRPLAEGGRYVAEFKGSAVVSTTGLPYNQLYIALFEISDGRVLRFREYMDPLVLGVALQRVQRIA
jgi:ketosteroid isomerase-like protein